MHLKAEQTTGVSSSHVHSYDFKIIWTEIPLVRVYHRSLLVVENAAEKTETQNNAKFGV